MKSEERKSVFNGFCGRAGISYAVTGEPKSLRPVRKTTQTRVHKLKTPGCTYFTNLKHQGAHLLQT